MLKTEELQFNSPSRGKINFSEVIYSLVDFMEEEPKKKYRLVIGTDSKSNGINRSNNVIELVTAIVIHRIGSGGRYFWRKEIKENIYTLRQKIYEETNLSLGVAQKLINNLNSYLKTARSDLISSTSLSLSKTTPWPKYDLEIHIDIGQEGPTRDMIKEIVGMVQGFGFNAKTKPEAYAASKVADKYT